MTENDTALRDSVAQANRDGLIAVLNETGMLIASADFNKWRPTQRTAGNIPGMPVGVTCVATDGNLGIFVPKATEGHNLGSAFLGHVHRFEWIKSESEEGPNWVTGAPPPLFSMPSAPKPAAKPKGPTKKQRRAALLASI